jgi:hypothetical protein
LFQREIEMFKQVPFIEEWLEESEARGVARGEAEGEARGEALRARRMLLRQLQKRFGALPEGVVKRVEEADPDWCEEVAERLFEVESLEELGLLENGSRAV